MRKTRTKTVFGVITLVALAFALLMSVRFLLRLQAMQRAFATIKAGDSPQSVIDRLGSPNYHDGSCGYLGGIPAGCVHEGLYDISIAPLEHYAVFYGSDGRVLKTYVYDSP